jgi:hypothetical protein
LYVSLLAVSSLQPHEQRLTANTLVSSLSFAATIAGPAIAGVLVTVVSAALSGPLTAALGPRATISGSASPPWCSAPSWCASCCWPGAAVTKLIRNREARAAERP